MQLLKIPYRPIAHPPVLDLLFPSMVGGPFQNRLVRGIDPVHYAPFNGEQPFGFLPSPLSLPLDDLNHVLDDLGRVHEWEDVNITLAG